MRQFFPVLKLTLGYSYTFIKYLVVQNSNLIIDYPVKTANLICDKELVPYLEFLPFPMIVFNTLPFIFNFKLYVIRPTSPPSFCYAIRHKRDNGVLRATLSLVYVSLRFVIEKRNKHQIQYYKNSFIIPIREYHLSLFALSTIQSLHQSHKEIFKRQNQYERNGNKAEQYISIGQLYNQIDGLPVIP